jgi:hypothetical protein
MHVTGLSILLIFVALIIGIMLYLLHLTRLGRLVHQHIPDRPQRRLFLAAVSFFLTFGSVRLLVIAIVYRIGPFDWVTIAGRHIHHLVWGILILLSVGYGYLLETGSQDTPVSIFTSRLLSILYGVGAALTLDEFSMWLNLQSDYWSRQGRENIDVVILFGALLVIGIKGAPLFGALVRKK